MKFLSIILLFFFSSVTSIIIHCDYKEGSSYGYKCEVGYLEIRSKSERNITGVTGQHRSGKNDNDVKFFHSSGKNLSYFPHHLTTFFKNLETIWINNAKLREISSDDLKPFEKLKRLSFGYNDLTIIEADPFKFNQNLEWLDLESNKIKHIDTGAFTNLKNLREFYFHGNLCHSAGASNRTAVVALTNVIEGKCKDAFYMLGKYQELTNERFKKLEDEIERIKIKLQM